MNYEGFTNYPTWSVYQEFALYELTGRGPERPFGWTPDDLKELVESSLSDFCDNKLTEAYALNFIGPVNWVELSSRIDANSGMPVWDARRRLPLEEKD